MHYTRHRDTLQGARERYVALCGVELNGPVDGEYLACRRDHDCAACREAVQGMVDGAVVRVG